VYRVTTNTTYLLHYYYYYHHHRHCADAINSMVLHFVYVCFFLSFTHSHFGSGTWAAGLGCRYVGAELNWIIVNLTLYLVLAISRTKLAVVLLSTLRNMSTTWQAASQLRTLSAYLWTFSRTIPSSLNIFFPFFIPTEFIVPVSSLSCYMYYFFVSI
jgi:hypothetical protein